MLKGHVFKLQTFKNEAFAHFIDTFLQGNVGITKGCELSNTDTSVTIGEGFFVIAGRFLQILDNETISDLTDDGYYKLVCEIDLSKENTTDEFNQGSIKVLKNTTTYPTLTQEDLFEDGNVYQYEFAKFRVTNNVITNFTDTRTFVNLTSIYDVLEQKFNEMIATKESEADTAIDEINQALADVLDGSKFILKTQIQMGTDIPTTLDEGTIYFQYFN